MSYANILAMLHEKEKNRLHDCEVFREMEEEDRSAFFERVERDAAEGRYTLLGGMALMEVEEFREHVNETLGFDPPADFLEFLRVADGLVLDRVTIFGSDLASSFSPGFIDQNRRNPDLLRQGVACFGVASTGVLLWARSSEEFRLVHRSDGAVQKRFGTFSEMLDYALDLEMNG